MKLVLLAFEHQPVDVLVDLLSEVLIKEYIFVLEHPGEVVVVGVLFEVLVPKLQRVLQVTQFGCNRVEAVEHRAHFGEGLWASVEELGDEILLFEEEVHQIFEELDDRVEDVHLEVRFAFGFDQVQSCQALLDVNERFQFTKWSLSL